MSLRMNQMSSDPAPWQSGRPPRARSCGSARWIAPASYRASPVKNAGNRRRPSWVATRRYRGCPARSAIGQDEDTVVSTAEFPQFGGMGQRLVYRGARGKGVDVLEPAASGNENRYAGVRPTGGAEGGGHPQPEPQRLGRCRGLIARERRKTGVEGATGDRPHGGIRPRGGRSCTSRAGTLAVAFPGDARLVDDMNTVRPKSQAANKQQRTSPPPRRTPEVMAPPPLDSDPCFLCLKSTLGTAQPGIVNSHSATMQLSHCIGEHHLCAAAPALKSPFPATEV